MEGLDRTRTKWIWQIKEEKKKKKYIDCIKRTMWDAKNKKIFKSSKARKLWRVMIPDVLKGHDTKKRYIHGRTRTEMDVKNENY